MKTCAFCNGQGAVTIPQGPQAGQLQACPVCDGLGFSDKSGYWFMYEYDFNLPANAAQAVPQQKDTVAIVNYDFKLVFLTGISGSAAGFLITLGDKSGNKPFSNAPVFSGNIFGTAQNPFPLLIPYTWKKGGLIQVDTSNLDQAAANQIRLTFHGVQLTSNS
jgi:hypothetical protein